VSALLSKADMCGATKDVRFAHAFATLATRSRTSRSVRSLEVSRRVARSLASYSAAAFTPSCFHCNKRSARAFIISGMMDNAWPGGFRLLAVRVAGRAVAPNQKRWRSRATDSGHLDFGFIQGELPHRLLDKFGLRLRNLILSHEHSDLMLDDDRRRKSYFSSKPVRAH